jgi:molecular chaperone Hsp33
VELGQHDDRLTPFVFERAALRGAIVRLDATAGAILAGHDYPPPIARALGELLAASALLASTLKLDGSMIVQLRGDGPLRLLVVECDGNLDLRATAQWSAADVAALGPDASLRALAGSGQARLAITLDPRGAGNLYQGIVMLQTESIAASIEHYLETSEQLPSRLVLATREGVTRGLLLQRLPESAPGDAATWTEASRRLSQAPRSLLEASNETALLRAVFPGDDLRVFAARAARFACKCSQARAANALRIAGQGEVEAALAESGHVEVTCEYCGRRYTFDPPAARALFEPGAQARRSG